MSRIIAMITFLFSNFIFAQVHYKGFVCDSISKLPLKNVEVFTNYENTLTNNNGAFDLKTTQKYVYLKTVFMGLPKVVSIKNFKTNDTLFLSPNVQLEEVVVTARKSILKQVINNLSKNYNLDKKYKTEMFTHSSLLVNEEPKLFLEMVSENTMNFEIDSKKSKGIFGLSRKTKTNILGLRKTTSDPNSEDYKNSLFMSNIIDWAIAPLNFLNKGVTKIEEYEDYYMLHYDYTNNLFRFSGWFSVNKVDYAIIENYEKKEALLKEKQLLKYSIPKIEISHIFFDKKEDFLFYTRKLLIVKQEFIAYNDQTNTIDQLEINFKMFNYNPTFNELQLPDPINATYYNYVHQINFPFSKKFWDNYNAPLSNFDNDALYQNLESLKE